MGGTSNSALLVVTDLHHMKRLEGNTPTWWHMALREEHLGVDSILFLDRSQGLITHVAYLQKLCPWMPIVEGHRVTAHTPVISEVDEILDPVSIPEEALKRMESIGCLPEANIEAVAINDVDELFSAAVPWLIFHSEVHDEFTLNRRCTGFIARLGNVLRLQDQAAALEEWNAGRVPGLAADQMDELPPNWKASDWQIRYLKDWEGTPTRSLVFLLNSALVSPKVKVYGAVSVEEFKPIKDRSDDPAD